MTKKNKTIILKGIGFLILAAFLIIGMISCDKKIPSISYLDEPASDSGEDTPSVSDSGDDTEDTADESQDISEGVSDDDDEKNWTPFY